MAIWGVADPTPAALVYGTVAAGDVDCVAGTETTVITTGPLAGLSPGPYYPLILCALTVVLGAAAPSALQFAFRLGAGSDVDVYVVEPGLLVALAEFIVPVYLVGVNSASAWQGAGSTINITGLATTNDATVKFVGSRALVGLSRGPDI